MLITSNGYCFIFRRSSSNAETMLFVLRCITFRCLGLMMRDCKCSSGPGSSVAEMLEGLSLLETAHDPYYKNRDVHGKATQSTSIRYVWNYFEWSWYHLIGKRILRGEDQSKTYNLFASDFSLRSAHILDIFGTSLGLSLAQFLHSVWEKDGSRHNNLRNIGKGGEIVCLAWRR